MSSHNKILHFLIFHFTLTHNAKLGIQNDRQGLEKKSIPQVIGCFKQLSLNFFHFESFGDFSPQFTIHPLVFFLVNINDRRHCLEKSKIFGKYLPYFSPRMLSLLRKLVCSSLNSFADRMVQSHSLQLHFLFDFLLPPSHYFGDSKQP